MSDGTQGPRADRFDPHSAADILDELRELADESDQVAIGDVVEAIGERSYGPFLLLPALIEISPVGALPAVPTFLATVAALTAMQLLVGRDHLWLPGFIARRSRKSADIRKAADKLQKVAGWLDRWFHGRLPLFTREPFPRVAAAIVLLLCLLVPPLEFVPFASSAPMVPIAAFGLALLVRDGLLMVMATVLSLAALGLGVGLLVFGGGG